MAGAPGHLLVGSVGVQASIDVHLFAFIVRHATAGKVFSLDQMQHIAILMRSGSRARIIFL